jgi:hypothetical protein
MAETLHAEMHREHGAWASESGAWLDDIRLWQDELKTLQAQLQDFEKKVAKHAETLRKHAAAVHLHATEHDAHESALATYERGGAGEELPELAQKHQQEGVKQGEYRELHRKIKAHHHAVISHWNGLMKAIDAV